MNGHTIKIPDTPETRSRVPTTTPLLKPATPISLLKLQPFTPTLFDLDETKLEIETEDEIKEKFRFTKSLHTAHVNSVKKAGLVERKDLAEAFMRIKDGRINTGVLFLMLDGRDPDLKIWDMVKPEYSRPFSSKGEI